MYNVVEGCANCYINRVLPARLICMTKFVLYFNYRPIGKGGAIGMFAPPTDSRGPQFFLINDLKQSDLRVLFLTLKDAFSSILRHKKANSKDIKTLKQLFCNNIT